MSSNPVATPITGAVTPVQIKITGDTTRLKNPNTTIDPATGVCNPNPVYVSRKVAGRNVDIQFKIAGGEDSEWTWSTTPPAIVVHGPEGLFSEGNHPSNNPKAPVYVHDRNDPQFDKTYKYTATFINTRTQEQKVVDPEVVNEN